MLPVYGYDDDGDQNDDGEEVKDLPRNPKHQTSVSRRWFAATLEPSTCKGPACCFGSSIEEPEYQYLSIAILQYCNC